jgi:hypothetical protein
MECSTIKILVLLFFCPEKIIGGDKKDLAGFKNLRGLRWERSNFLWPHWELAGPADGAVFDVGDAAVGQHVTVGVGYPEGVRAGTHAGFGLDKVVVAGAGD